MTLSCQSTYSCFHEEFELPMKINATTATAKALISAAAITSNWSEWIALCSATSFEYSADPVMTCCLALETLSNCSTICSRITALCSPDLIIVYCVHS